MVISQTSRKARHLAVGSNFWWSKTEKGKTNTPYASVRKLPHGCFSFFTTEFTAQLMKFMLPKSFRAQIIVMERPIIASIALSSSAPARVDREQQLFHVSQALRGR